MVNSLNKVVKVAVLVLIVFVFIAPQTILGQESGELEVYSPLAPLPGVTDEASLSNLGDSGQFAIFINNVFNFTVGVATLLAILQIALGGIKYMTSDVVSNKEDAKKQIWGAVRGLLLLLAITVVLTQINPELIRIKLGPDNLGTTPTNLDLCQSCINEGGVCDETTGEFICVGI